MILCYSGCYEKSIFYSYMDGDTRVPIPLSQIESLIELSDFCDQDFHYDCNMAPLTNGPDFAFWEGRTGEMNNYFTGDLRSPNPYIFINVEHFRK